MTLLLNIFDYLILVKYYNTFLRECRKSHRLFFGLHSVAMVLAGMYINSLGNQLYNICITLSIFIFTSLYYCEKLIYKVIIIACYLGISMISETFIISILGNVDILSNEIIGYASIFICQLFKLCLVMLISTFKRERNQKLPSGTTFIITLIFIISTVGSIILNWTPINEKQNDNVLSNLIIMIIFLVIFLLLFILLNKFNAATRLNYEQNMIIQESMLKESYYKEIDKNNLMLRRISHDFKNQLAPLIGLNEKDLESAKITIQNLFDDFSNMEGEIHTRNNALNSICIIKFAKAKSLNVDIQYEINLPEAINISYGEMGIIFGNLLDNGIEACEKVDVNSRFIKLKVELCTEILLISLENSKSIKFKVDSVFKTNKTDEYNHGFGMKSVIDTVKKYDGIYEMEDLNDTFRLKIILMGISERCINN